MPVSPSGDNETRRENEQEDDNNEENQDNNQENNRTRSGVDSTQETHLTEGRGNKKKDLTAKELVLLSQLPDPSTSSKEVLVGSRKTSKSKSRGGVSSRTHQYQQPPQEIETLAPLEQGVPSNGPTTPVSGIQPISTAQEQPSSRRTRSLGRESSRSQEEEDAKHSRSGSKKCVTKILLCGGGSSSQERVGESKRKEVGDENNPLSLNPDNASSTILTHRGRKASRKGSSKKKSSKESIPLNTLEDTEAGKDDADATKEPKTTANNKSCCFCWCCCCSCSW